MRKQTIAGITLVLGMLSVGAASAAEPGSCCIGGTCSDQSTMQHFVNETAGFRSALAAKDIELRELAGYGTYDIREEQALENEIRVIKEKIGTVGKKYGIPDCCRV